MKIPNDTHIYPFTSPEIQLTDIQCILLPAARAFLICSQYFSVFLICLCYVSVILLVFFFACFKVESNLFHFKLYINNHFSGAPEQLTHKFCATLMQCIMGCMSNHKMKAMELLLPKQRSVRQSSTFWYLSLFVAQFRIFMVSVGISHTFFAECCFGDGSDFDPIKWRQEKTLLSYLNLLGDS